MQAPNQRVGYVYLIPFFLLMIARTYYFGADVNAVDQGDPVIKTALGSLGYLVAGFLVFSKQEEVRAITRKFIPYFLYALYAAGTMLWSSFPSLVALRVGHMVGVALVAICTGIWASNRRSSIVPVTMYFLFVALVVSILFVEFLPVRGIENVDWDEGDVWSSRWVGVTQHPNLLGALAMISVWAALSQLFLDKGKFGRVIAIATLIGSAVVLVGSDSRTAEISVFVLVTFMLIIPGTRSLGSRGISIKSKTLLIGIIACLLVAVVIVWKGGLSFLQPTTRAGATDILSGRPEIWAAGIQAISENPFGWSYDILGTYWLQHSSPDGFEFTHFHNGYLDVAVKGGFIAEAIFLLMLYRMGSAIHKLRRHDPLLYKFFQPFFLCNLFYNLTETGFDQEDLLWLAMVLVWVCAEVLVVRRAHEDSPSIGGIRNLDLGIDTARMIDLKP